MSYPPWWQSRYPRFCYNPWMFHTSTHNCILNYPVNGTGNSTESAFDLIERPLFRPGDMMQCHDSHIRLKPPKQTSSRVMIQFKSLPLLKKFPGIQRDDIRTHPYRMQLKKEYQTWLQEIKARIPDFNAQFTFDTLFSGISASVPMHAIPELEKFPFIQNVFPDVELLQDQSLDNSAFHTSEFNQNAYNLEIINYPPTRQLRDTKNNPLDGRGIVVAVMEKMGVNIPELRFGALGKVIDQYDFSTNSTIIPSDNHGLIVTQIILDVAPNVSILAYVTKYYSEYVAASERAVVRGADIINASLHFYRIGNVYNEVIKIDNLAFNAGTLVVRSSGNRKASRVTPEKKSPNILTVGGTTYTGDQVAPYSDYGAEPPLWTIKPDVVAPGTYEFRGVPRRGTSYAAPYVSGSAALMRQFNPTMNPNEIKSLLATTSTIIKNRDPEALFSQGSGRINLFRAVTTKTILSPSSLSFELADEQTVEQFLSIKNTTDDLQTYTINWVINDDGIVGEISDRILVVPAKTERVVTASLRTTVNGMFRGEIQVMSDHEAWHLPVLIIKEEEFNLFD